MSKAGRPRKLSEQEVRVVKDEYNMGVLVKDIASRHNVHAVTVGKYLRAVIGHNIGKRERAIARFKAIGI